MLGFEADKRLFLECAHEGMTRYGVELHAYSLMDTHYHLLVFSKLGGLSDAMRFVGGKFTRLMNQRGRSDGPIFRGRFKSVSIEADEQLIETMRYIHSNAVEAGLVSRAEGWEWSSAAVYAGTAPKPPWLTTTVLSQMLGTPVSDPAGLTPSPVRAIDMRDATADRGSASGKAPSPEHGVRPGVSDTIPRGPT